MGTKVRGLKRVRRRDALRATLMVPAALVATRWLAACGESDGDTQDASLDPSTMGDAGAQADSSALPTQTAANDASTPTAADASTPPANGNAPDSGTASAPDAQAQAPDAQAQDASDASSADGASDSAVTSDASVIGDAGPNTPWASGGTKSMSGNYPDPFTAGTQGSMCMLYPSQTLGPCYARMPPMREDISEGVTGLPLRLSFLVVGQDGCTPVPNASVDVWHSGFNGVYSAFNTGTICNPGREDVLAQRYCRGVQVADARGRVDFNTIFPGWYTGRTIHIHFTVRIGSRDAVTSQLYFEDALCDEILAQGEYAGRGRRDTTNGSDSIFRSGGATAASVVFSTAKRADGVLHAWKVLSIRSA